ncbi:MULTISPECIES: DNA-directed RNA polymerase subunit delta [Bacillaceae]|uniref:Probable DNA-directed RNA polymerase subunit delta n=1 Tax=Alkalicoccobacillus plakortidis TaxID=444060 RepID=A0A9D5HZJ0_9BACI|nr:MULTISPECIES: DNA-directed RNA polymerase subunit delta [Bacillaceae]KQL58848.1 DNA-directed RNA polymerase subunit delta [Alkalicoccobacillus plakortidis]
MVDLQSLNQEQLDEMSMVEAAFAIMVDQKKAFNFYDLLEEVAKLKGLSRSEAEARISFLYTDLNIDGRFLTLGDNQWGLKAWYPHEQSEEEITHSVKPKRRKTDEDEDDFDAIDELEEDEFEDLEDELDELADEEDHDEEEDEDDDFTDKDEDEDLGDFDDDDESSSEEEED